ncbi:hypothetical protein O181_010959 [Austropuccinia psidii MF-1]|uniref:Uncharacterized protein n=1 Tax=Austropuccinia psidii MF-1 TaxID=1389203 RepID=A0A9Q3BTM6_9BASI|nr:hypothetical protein [Austropuccinia psidii MF-1]
MEHGQQDIQPSNTRGRTWSKFPEDASQRDTLQISYGNHQRNKSQQEVQTPGGVGIQLIRSRLTQLSSAFTPFRQQQIGGQYSPFFTIPGSFQEETRIQREKQYLFQPQEERVRPNDPEAVGLGEKSTQEPEIVVNTSRFSTSLNRDITPTQNEHNVVTPESNLNSDQLWLQMSQFAVKTQEKFDELHRSNEKLKELTTLHEATIKAIQEGCAKLCKPSEETNERLNKFFEEKYHCKRERDCLY